MRQIPFPFPGEDDHFSRLLTTAEFLAQRGKLLPASEVLKLAAEAAATRGERARLREVAESLLDRIDGARAQAPAPPRLRLLRFPSEASRAAKTLAFASSRPSPGTT